MDFNYKANETTIFAKSDSSLTNFPNQIDLIHINSIFRLKEQPKRLALKLSKKGEKHVHSGHPWLFSDRIEKINKEGNAGDIAIIFGRMSNSVIGVGLYDPDSPIRVKMLNAGGGITIDDSFFRIKIHDAFAKRESLLQTETNSYRLIFGENDGFPGLIADVYDNVLVIKLYSEIWLPYFEIIHKHLIHNSECDCTVLRLSRNLQNSKNILAEDGTVIYGILKSEIVLFKEHSVNFSANVIKGHKTGYFLDHRFNRKHVGELSNGKTVLDVFSYAGGFSVHALANDASKVTSVDISAQALEVAKANGNLNNYNGEHLTIAGDAFEVLQSLINDKKRYDIVVIDPPSFAKQQSEIDLAKKKYAQLARLGVQLVSIHGILVLASCSSRVTAQAFFDINKKVLKDQSRSFQLINSTTHDIDHPISFPEGAYLKCGYYKMDV